MAKSGKPKGPIEHPVSAGGVVFRRGDRGLELILCGRREPPLWALPKGSPDAGEDLEAAALREVKEETGVEGRIIAKVGTIKYWFTWEGTRYFKTVHHYLVEPVGGSPDLHDPEFDEVRWFSAEEALAKLTYKDEAEIVKKALALLAEKARKGEEGGYPPG